MAGDTTICRALLLRSILTLLKEWNELSEKGGRDEHRHGDPLLTRREADGNAANGIAAWRAKRRWDKGRVFRWSDRRIGSRTVEFRTGMLQREPLSLISSSS